VRAHIVRLVRLGHPLRFGTSASGYLLLIVRIGVARGWVSAGRFEHVCGEVSGVQ
jgi:hypothetical protein